MKKLQTFLLISLLAFFFSACADEDDKNSTTQGKPSPIKLTMTITLGSASTTALTVPAGDAAGNALDLTDFKLSVHEIEFEREGDGGDSDSNDDNSDDSDSNDGSDDSKNSLVRSSTDDGSSSDDSNDSSSDDGSDDSSSDVEFKGPYVLDMLDGDVTVGAVIGDGEIPAGTYDGIKFEIYPATGTNDATIEGRSIYLEGTVDRGAGPEKLVVWHKIREEFWLTGTNGITVDNNTANDLVVDFDLGSAISAMDFTHADLTEDISPDAVSEVNRTLAEAFKKALKAAADFGEDHDHDGELHENEDVNDDGDRDKS